MPSKSGRYVLDAHAWIEYLRGSPPGRRVREMVEESTIYTTALTLAEVVDHVAQAGEDSGLAARAIKTLSDVVKIDDELAVKAAKRHARISKRLKDFTLGQAYLIETAKSLGAEIVTGDKRLSSARSVLIE